MLSKETINEIKKVFEKECGVKWTDQEAHEAAHNLVGFFSLLYKIDQRNKKEENQNDL